MSLVTDATGNDLTYRIIGAAMAVHNEIGYGFKEEVYEKALQVKLNQEGVGAERQYPISVQFEGSRWQSFIWIYLQKVRLS